MTLPHIPLNSIAMLRNSIFIFIVFLFCQCTEQKSRTDVFCTNLFQTSLQSHSIQACFDAYNYRLTDKYVVIEPARNIADSLFVVEHIHRKDYQLMVNVLVELNLIEKNEKIDTAIWKNICVHYSLGDRLREFVYDSLKNKEGVLKSEDVYFMNRQEDGYIHFNIETYKTFLKSNPRTAKSKQDFSSAKMLSYPCFSESRNAMLVCVKKPDYKDSTTEFITYLLFKRENKWSYHIFDAVYRDRFDP